MFKKNVLGHKGQTQVQQGHQNKTDIKVTEIIHLI